MNWETLTYAVGSFVLGLLSGLLKLFAPGYMDLYRENTELREKIRACEDTMRDQQDVFDGEIGKKDGEITKLKSELTTVERRRKPRA